MLEAKLPTDACKGGRNLLCDNTSVDAFAMKPWSEQLVILQAIAKIKGFTNVWNSVVQPWLQGKSTGVGSLQASKTFDSAIVATGRVPAADEPAWNSQEVQEIMFEFQPDPNSMPSDEDL